MPVDAVKVGDRSLVPAPEPARAAPGGAAAPGEGEGGRGLEAVAAAGARGQRADPAALQRALQKLNALTFEAPVRLSFRLHKASGRMMVRVINEETGEVIKEIPPKEILDTIARIMEFVGLLLDRRA